MNQPHLGEPKSGVMDTTTKPVTILSNKDPRRLSTHILDTSSSPHSLKLNMRGINNFK